MKHGDVIQPPVLAARHPTNSKVHWQSDSSFVSAVLANNIRLYEPFFLERDARASAPPRGGSSRGGGTLVAGPVWKPREGTGGQSRRAANSVFSRRGGLAARTAAPARPPVRPRRPWTWRLRRSDRGATRALCGRGGRAAVAGARGGSLLCTTLCWAGCLPSSSSSRVVNACVAWTRRWVERRHDGASGEALGGRAAAGRERHRGRARLCAPPLDHSSFFFFFFWLRPVPANAMARARRGGGGSACGGCPQPASAPASAAAASAAAATAAAAAAAAAFLAPPGGGLPAIGRCPVPGGGRSLCRSRRRGAAPPLPSPGGGGSGGSGGSGSSGGGGCIHGGCRRATMPAARRRWRVMACAGDGAAASSGRDDGGDTDGTPRTRRLARPTRLRLMGQKKKGRPPMSMQPRRLLVRRGM